jgi:hypothetical protein
MFRSFVGLMLLLALAGCTAFYERAFTVVPEDQLDLSERQALYVKTRELLIAKGYRPVPGGVAPGVEGTAFQIRDAQSRLLPSHGVREFITLRMTNDGVVEVRLSRVSNYPPDDFSDKYVSDFAAITEQLIREASGRNAKLVVVSGN